MHKRTEGLKRLRHSAGLDGYPLPPIHDEQRPARALIVTCAESPVLSAFVASLDPLCVLQNLGGALPGAISGAGKAGDEMTCGTIEYALNELGLRHIVLLGHSSCRVPSMRRRRERSLAPAQRVDEPGPSWLRAARGSSSCDNLSQAWLLEQMARLRDRLTAGRLATGTEVATHALWFAEDQGDLFAYSGNEERFVLASDLEMERLFSLLEAGADAA